MKQVNVTGDGGARVLDVATPRAQGDIVVVKVMASAISGTERRVYQGHALDPWAGMRANGGHEAAGVVVEAEAAGTLREGDRVALYGGYRHCGRCRHCLTGRWLFCADATRPPQAAGYHAQYVQIRSDFCLPLPDGVDFEAGALLATPFGAVFRAVRRAGLAARERVLVVGQGPLGLAATVLCRHLGGEVIVCEPNPFRRELALACGADAVIDPAAEDIGRSVRAFSGEDGADVAIDCSGVTEGRAACLDGVGRGGRIALVGAGGGWALTPDQAAQIIAKEAEFKGTWYVDPGEALALADFFRRGLSPLPIVTHRFGIDAATEAFTTAFGGHAGAVLLLPWT